MIKITTDSTCDLPAQLLEQHHISVTPLGIVKGGELFRVWSFNSLIQVFKKMRAEIRGTIITISHQERILDIADKIVLLVDGKIEKIGSKEDVFEDKKFVSSTCKFLEKGGKING